MKRRQKLERQLDRELRFHLEQHAADLIAAGVAPDEARRQANLALGGPEQVKESCRDVRAGRWVEDLWRDFLYALRTLRQNPGFAAVALLTLALGTGAATIIFTVFNGVLLKPLPFPQPDRLLALQEQTDLSTRWGNLWSFSYLNYLDCKQASRSLTMAAWRSSGGTVSGAAKPEYVDAGEISADLFSVLGIQVLRGRAFLPEEDRRSAPPVSIVSYGLWQRRFGGDPSVIGQTLVYEGKAHTIVGVMPPGFRLGGNELDVFTPLAQETGPFMQDRGVHRSIGVWARLRPGVTLSQARQELTLIGSHLAGKHPKSNKGRTFIAEPLRADVGDVRPTLWLLLGAVVLVLSIACVNVASLLLARAVARQRELAMRMALGAGRGRLVRQCLTESAVLALAGGGLGIALAAMAIRPFVVFWPGSLPRANEVQLDWRVLLSALAASLLCGLLFGLAPALRAPVRQIESMLGAGSRSVQGSSRGLHAGFVISEIALAMVLLVCAGMLGRTMLRLSALDPGVDIRNVVTARMALSPATLEEPAKIRAAWNEVLENAHHVPGVQTIAMVDTVPMRQGNNTSTYWTTPVAPSPQQQPVALTTSVTPDYLRVMGIALQRGRFFTNQDRFGGEPVVVIDELLARKAFGAADPVGKRLWVEDLGSDPVRVVGVVGHVRYWGLAGDDQAAIRAQLYYPFSQVPDQYLRHWSELMSIAVRTSVAPLSVVEPLRRELRGEGGDQVLYEVRTMEQLASGTLARQRFLLLLFGIFAGLALVLASVGIYGVLAYLTGQRVPEMGVRIALGASRRDVIALILRQSCGMIFAGVGVGMAAALGAGKVLAHQVQGVRPMEWGTFAAMITLLVFAALFASFLPARRASRVDPMRALRQE